MESSDTPRKPVDVCPECGAPVELDILYHGPGKDGFIEYCTKCEWTRESHFTGDIKDSIEISKSLKKYSDREIINKWILANNNPLTKELLKKTGLGDYPANGFIGFCYIDHDAGISIRIQALCSIEPDALPKIIVNSLDTGHDLILRYGVIDDFKILGDELVNSLSLPSEPDWLENYEPLKYADIRDRREIDQFRFPGFFDDVSVVLFSENQELTPEVVWVRLEEILNNDPLFRGKLLNQPNNDFGVQLGDNILVALYEFDGGSYLIAENKAI